VLLWLLLKNVLVLFFYSVLLYVSFDTMFDDATWYVKQRF